MSTLIDKPQNKAPVHDPLLKWLTGLTVGEPQLVDKLEVTPLAGGVADERPWVLLPEALETKALEIKEHDGGGQVNEVVAHNRGEKPVLIIEGDTIVGAKQNRMVVASVLVAAHSMVGVPVGCVEQGRWHAISSLFEIGDMKMSTVYRKAAVAEYVKAKSVNQRRLWADVAAEMVAAKLHSPSADYHELLKKQAEHARSHEKAFASVDGQVGWVVTYEDKLLGIEILGHPDDWGAISKRLVSSYVAGLSRFEAVSKTKPGMHRRSADEWLTALRYAKRTEMPARGMGINVAIEGDGLSGSALLYGERGAHLGVFG